MERIPPHVRGEHTIIIKTSISINGFLLEYASIEMKKNRKKRKKIEKKVKSPGLD
jgi:hypothetical protein